jgi:hypothetical protein
VAYACAKVHLKEGGMTLSLYVFFYCLFWKHCYMRSCGIAFIEKYRKSKIICDLLQNTIICKHIKSWKGHDEDKCFWIALMCRYHQVTDQTKLHSTVDCTTTVLTLLWQHFSDKVIFKYQNMFLHINHGVLVSLCNFAK